MAKITLSLSGSVTKSSVLAVFRRRAKSGVITSAQAEGFASYIDKNPEALKKAIDTGKTATKTAEHLFKARFKKTMELEKSHRQDKEKAEAEKNKPVFKKEDSNSDVVDRWTAYAKKEKLSKKEIQDGLNYINHHRKFNKHDGSIENKSGFQIWTKLNS